MIAVTMAVMMVVLAVALLALNLLVYGVVVWREIRHI